MRMMKKTNILIVLMVTVLAAISCKSQYDALLASQDVPEKYKAAFEYFEKGKYSKAASLFESMKLIVSGLPQEDTVNFYTALSHYRFGDLVTAESAFSSFYSSFPRSPFVNEARFLYLECLYSQTLRYELDQLPTHKAMAAVNEFMVDFPDNEYSARCREMMDDFKNRLERKAFEAARIYYTTEDYKAAHYAFKDVLKENAETQYREKVLYYVALSSYKLALNSIVSKQKERFMTFTDEYYNFIGEYPESQYRKGIDILYRKAQAYLKKVEEGKLSRKETRQAKKETRHTDKSLNDKSI